MPLKRYPGETDLSVEPDGVACADELSDRLRRFSRSTSVAHEDAPMWRWIHDPRPLAGSVSDDSEQAGDVSGPPGPDEINFGR